MTTVAGVGDFVSEEEVRKEEVKESEDVEVERKSGVQFPVTAEDGKELASLGLRKKGLLGVHLKIYSFGIYADAAKMEEVLKVRFPVAPATPTKELYETVIDADVGLRVRIVMVFGGLSMSIVRKSFDEGIGASLKKLTGGQKNDELLSKIMGEASGDMTLGKGSVIEITRLPGYTLQTKVRGEVVSTVESELLCRAYFHMYLGDDPFDKEAKDRVGSYLLSFLQGKE